MINESLFGKEDLIKRINNLPSTKYKDISQVLDSIEHNLIEHNERISSLPFMKYLNDEEKRVCFKELTQCSNIPIPLNTNLFGPETALDIVYFITSGLIKLSSKVLKHDSKSNDEKEKPFQLLTIGDMLGELEIFKDHNHKTVCTATAVLEDAECIGIKKNEFKLLMEKNPKIFKWFCEQLSLKIIRQGIEWNSQDDFIKLLFALVIICDNPAFTKNRKSITITANQEELGKIIGINRHKIGRYLGLLEKIDIVIKGRDEYTIINPIKLKENCIKIDTNGLFTYLYNRA